MTDRREAILAQLLVIATTTPGVKTAARNRDAPSDEELPAIIIYDGDEATLETDDAPGDLRRPSAKPRRVAMTATLEISLGAQPEDVGTDVNVLRAYMIRTILQDATLLSLVQDGKGIHYLGASMGSDLGRALQANMILNFAFTYLLSVSDL